MLTLIPWAAMYISFPSLPLATANQPPISAAGAENGVVFPATWHPAPPHLAALTSAPPSDKPAPAAAVTGYARIQLAADYPGASLEASDLLEVGVWRSVCATPCDRVIFTENQRLRVSAPRMTRSNEFLIQPGAGSVGLRVSGGSNTARVLGIWALGVGLPLTLGGGALYSYGRVYDNADFTVPGVAVLAVGALGVLSAVPLLLSGSTTVRASDGKFVAAGRELAWRF